MKLIVGLGNPSKEYENTRHNVGFMFCDYFINEHNLDGKQKFDGILYEYNYQSEKILILKPQTYMNLSGESVIKVKNFYNLENEDILVIYDDLDLEFGKIRTKYKSSSGGHNGIKNIINHLKTEQFLRIKYGIRNEYKKDTKTFVLSKFNKEELQQIEEDYQIIKQIIDKFIENDNDLYCKTHNYK